MHRNRYGYRRPRSLRWPFLVTQVVLLAAAIIALVLLLNAMPDSDDSALIDGRPRGDLRMAHSLSLVPSATPSGTAKVHYRRNETTAIFRVTIQPQPSASVTSSSSEEDEPEFAPGLEPAEEDYPVLDQPMTISATGIGPGSQTVDEDGPDDDGPGEDDYFALNTPMTISSAGAMPGMFRESSLVTLAENDRDRPPPFEVTDSGVHSFATHSPAPAAAPAVPTPVAPAAPLAAAPETFPTVSPTDIAIIIPVVETITRVIQGKETTITPTPVVITTVERRPVTRTSTPAPYITMLGGTTVTITPTPVVIATVEDDETPITRTSTPKPFVTTLGGTTITITRTTTRTTSSSTNDDRTSNERPTIPPASFPSDTTGHDNKTSDSDPKQRGVRVFPPISEIKYFSFAFLPTFLAAALTVPISIIDLNAKLVQPFRALRRPSGASGPDSMTLRFDGLQAILTPVRQLVRAKDAVTLITTLLVGLSWLLAPLASEAVEMKVHGTCSHVSIKGCAIAGGVSELPAWTLIGVLAVMIALLLLLAVLLHYQSADVPMGDSLWSVGSIAVLTRNYCVRDPLLDIGDVNEKQLDAVFKTARFKLTPSISADTQSPRRQGERSCVSGFTGSIPCIVPHNGSIGNIQTRDIKTGTGPKPNKTNKAPTPQKHRTPFLALTYTCRAVLATLLLSLMALTTYYRLLHEDNAFELFMNSQTFGVKFLFAALGGIFGIFWSSFFLSVATAWPFLVLSSRRASAKKTREAIDYRPPTNAFSGMLEGIRQRDILLFVAAFMAAVADVFLPMLLSNIPYSLTQTVKTHRYCSNAALAVLGSMVVVLVGSMAFVRWPHMPVDPRTVAGMAYYVADSEELRGEVMARVSGEDGGTGKGYFYGRVVGSNGRARMVIDSVG
ncbi:hypothetical protein QBC34DRAFT_493767 [Podospora aff. communis PSN243]|uniref:Uncharacterized protein n=1 Tax=Podospora aff. communis PSN243 TaxID=3040156 RepID=A0AAV9GV95_9PEZI|nr:hypothetical protein QBC34DRAFT_493767 [Podospora aff. communis PSN243]